MKLICANKELIAIGEDSAFSYAFGRILKAVGFSQNDIYTIHKRKITINFKK